VNWPEKLCRKLEMEREAGHRYIYHRERELEREDWVSSTIPLQRYHSYIKYRHQTKWLYGIAIYIVQYI
jgi:hypothetical protein